MPGCRPVLPGVPPGGIPFRNFPTAGGAQLPEHGVALREGCPNCRGWIVPDARTRGALTCAHCAAPLCPWSPPLDGVLASERFPALEALGRALREHAGRRGYAQRTFVLGPRPYDAPQGALLALWTDSDPHRIRAFVPKLRRARWRGDGRAPVWPVELRPVYLAFADALERRTVRRGRADPLAVAVDRWRREARDAPVEDLAELTSFPIVLAHTYESGNLGGTRMSALDAVGPRCGSPQRSPLPSL